MGVDHFPHDYAFEDAPLDDATVVDGELSR